MTAKYQRLKAGDPLNGLSASTWNALVDGLESRRPALDAGPGGTDPTPTTIKVRNQTGANRARGAVVSITGIAVDAPANPCFDVGLPTTNARHAVLLEPIRTGNVGEAAIAGCTKTECEITNIDIPAVEWNGIRMASHLAGCHKILLPVASTGVQLVYLQLFAWEQLRYRGTTATDIVADSSGAVNIAGFTGVSVTAFNDWMHGGVQVSSGKKVIVEWFRHELKWRITNAECEV